MDKTEIELTKNEHPKVANLIDALLDVAENDTIPLSDINEVVAIAKSIRLQKLYDARRKIKNRSVTRDKC